METEYIPVIKQKPRSADKIYPSCEYILHFDGSSKGNPGPAGMGAVIYKNNDEIWGGAKYLGDYKTNNQAEYSALIYGLKQAIELGIEELLVFGDSQLVINQVNQVFKVKNPGLLELYKEAYQLTKQFKYIELIHVYRDKNTRADELSNIALTLIP
jgi:ribonuclease HI